MPETRASFDARSTSLLVSHLPAFSSTIMPCTNPKFKFKPNARGSCALAAQGYRPIVLVVSETLSTAVQAGARLHESNTHITRQAFFSSVKPRHCASVNVMAGPVAAVTRRAAWRKARARVLVHPFSAHCGHLDCLSNVTLPGLSACMRHCRGSERGANSARVAVVRC